MTSQAKPFNNFFCIKVHVLENNSIFLNGGSIKCRFTDQVRLSKVINYINTDVTDLKVQLAMILKVSIGGYVRKKLNFINSTGKVSVKTLSKANKRELNKEQRRHQALQIRQNKRNEVLNKKRSLGGLDYAPFLVCLVPLSKNADPKQALECLTKCDSEAIINKSPTGVTHIWYYIKHKYVEIDVL
jgi:hypothetical protein